MEDSPSQGPAYWWAPGRGPMKALWVWRFFWTLKLMEKMGQQKFRAHRGNHHFFSDIKWCTFAQTICFAFSFTEHVHFCFLFLSLPATDTNIIFLFRNSLIFVPWSQKWVFGIDGSISCGFCPGATWIHYVAAFYSFMPMTWGKLWRIMVRWPLEGLLKVDFES